MLSGGGRKLRREQSLRGAADGFDNNNFGGGGHSKQQLGKNVSTPLNGMQSGGGGGAVKAARSVTAVNHHAALTRNGPTYGRSGGGTSNRVVQNGEGAAQQAATPSTHRFGHPDLRSSYSERSSGGMRHHPQRPYGLHQPQQQQPQHRVGPPAPHPPPPHPHPGGGGGVYKSNSSLDLEHEVDMVKEAMTLAATTAAQHHPQQQQQQPHLFLKAHQAQYNSHYHHIHPTHQHGHHPVSVLLAVSYPVTDRAKL